MRASKSKGEALARLRGQPEPNHAEGPEAAERLQAFAEAIEWLEDRRRQVGLDPEGPEFQEVMLAVEEHRDFLNERWCSGGADEFRESLRRYARACSQEMLRTYRARQARGTTQESLEVGA